MNENDKTESQFPTYRGKPLVRCGDVLYYGSMLDQFVVRLEIRNKKKLGDMEIADRVTVQLMRTDLASQDHKQIVKSSEKNGLYLAMDLADIWLRRALTEGC